MEKKTSRKQSQTVDQTLLNKHPVIPDGGYGWVVTIASFMCHFIADGIAFSIGVIYSDLLNTFGSSKSATSWIASLFVGVPLISGPVAGLFVTKYGCRPATILGGLITSAGMLVSSFAPSIELLTFTYGVVAGFGLAFVYVPASVMPSFWFEKRRSLATGIAVAGSGLGTFAIAPLTEYLLDEYGWRGTLLVMSGITLNFIVFGALFREVPEASSIVSPLNQKRASLQSLPSIASEQSVVPSRDLSHKILISSSPVLSAPERMHHSTNTVCTGEFEPLHASSNRREANVVIHRPSIQHSSFSQLLRSKQNLFPVSRHDITSVMTLAMRQRTISSCPDLSIATDDESEENDEDDADSKQAIAAKKSKKRLTVKARHIIAEMCSVRLFTEPVYLIFFISNFMLSYAYDLPYLYLPDYAATVDISRPSILIAIIGIVNTFGQVLFGYLGDKKCINTILLYGVSVLLCGLAVAFIPMMTSFSSLIIFSILFGLLISASYSLETVVLIKILSLDQLTKAYGLLMFGQGLASLIGPPLGG